MNFHFKKKRTIQTMEDQIKHIIHFRLNEVKRVVVKIGTRVIDDPNTQFNRPVIESLVNEMAALMQKGIEVILVSSGAVGSGIRYLGVQGTPKSLHLRQAYAAVGQARLMQKYSELFERYGIKTAQVLLTRSDLDKRTSYLNAQETLNHLLNMKVVPIINENDTVAVEELKFGDNDQLAALVAGKMDAQLLILLTTVDGIFQRFDPKTKTGDLIEVIIDSHTDITSHIHEDIDSMSTGGMQSKFASGKAAAAKGVLAVITNGLKQGIITSVMDGTAQATWVMPNEKQMAAWKYYLAYAKQPCNGKIFVDDGAVDAVKKRGKSLLSSGIQTIEGVFQEKELVHITDSNGNEFARGLVNYSSTVLQQIKGLSSEEISNQLHQSHPAPVVHRDNLVIL
jgi:glutamate 5-kinase